MILIVTRQFLYSEIKLWNFKNTTTETLIQGIGSPLNNITKKCWIATRSAPPRSKGTNFYVVKLGCLRLTFIAFIFYEPWENFLNVIIHCRYRRALGVLKVDYVWGGHWMRVLTVRGQLFYGHCMITSSS